MIDLVKHLLKILLILQSMMLIVMIKKYNTQSIKSISSRIYLRKNGQLTPDISDAHSRLNDM